MSRCARAFRVALVLTLAGAATRPVAAQSSAVPDCAFPGDLGGAREDLLRLDEVAGDRPVQSRGLLRPSDRFRPGGCPAAAGDPIARLGPVAVSLAPARIGGWYRSGYPADRNNGVVWAGRGISAVGAAGVRLRWGRVRAALAPALAFQDNDDFTTVPRALPGFSPFLHPFQHTIDLPQRFGTNHFETIHPGDSYVRIDFDEVGLGVSTENVWVGPAIRNPIVMSNTAPGFPHVFLEAPAIDFGDTRIGLEALHGWLEESDHFDSDPSNDGNRLLLWTLTVAPGPLPGLEIGYAHAYMYAQEHSAYFALFGAERAADGNELMSLFARWTLPGSGAELYAEVAREERWSGLDDLVNEPDHSQGFSLGAQKLSTLGPLRLRLQAELVHLQEKREGEGRAPVVYYTHEQVKQGYTHRGQLLGAPIGPGADAQFVALDALFDDASAGLFVERARRNDLTWIAVETRRHHPYRHDVEVTTGLRGHVRIGELLAAGTVAYAWRWNRDFLQDDTNLALELELSWSPQ